MNGRKAARAWLLLGSWALAAMGGCGKASSDPPPRYDDPRWLQFCDTGSGQTQCGSFSLECLCNVCTRGCSKDSECSGAGFEGRCVEPATTALAQACQSPAPAKICVRAPGTGAPRMGRPRNEAARCYGREELAGFSSEDALCRPFETVALAPGGGGCWLFPDSCLPDGFLDANFNPLLDPPPCGIPEVDICPGALSCDAGQAPTSSGCVSCDEAHRGLTLDVLEFVVRREMDECTFDTDCVAQDWELGCDDQCPTAIGREYREFFLNARPELALSYCSDPAAWRASCGERSVDCDSAALCRGGRCVLARLRCDQRELADCESDGDCALQRANPLNLTTQCFDSISTPVACVDPDFTCRAQIRAALAPDGNCFRVEGCMPPDFTRAPADHPCTAALSAQCAL